MPAPTILTSDMGGAPTLTGQDGALYDVFKWALPLLGWTIEFDDPPNYRIAFRNDPLGGSGSYIRINDLSANHATTSWGAAIRAFESMTDLDTGMFRTPNSDDTSTVSTTYAFLPKSATTDAQVIPYRFVGDAKSFMFETAMVSSPIDDRWCMALIGDLATRDPTDKCFHMVVANSTPTTIYSSMFTAYPYVTTGYQGQWFVRSLDGLTGALNGRFFISGHTLTSTSGTPGVSFDYQDRVTGNAAFCPAWVTDTELRVRGRIRGVWWPVGNWYTGHPFKRGTVEAVPTELGVRDLELKVGNGRTTSLSNYFMYLIDEVGDWSVF